MYIIDQAAKSNANYIKGFTSDGVPFITLVDYANVEGTYISSLAMIKFIFTPSYEDDHGNYQGGTIDIFSCITSLNAYFNCDVEVAEQKTLGVDTLTIRGNDVVSLINEIIDQKDFLPNTASAVANIISNNTSAFLEPFNYVISGNPSYFVGAVGAIISSAPSYFTSPIAEVMSAQPSVFSPAVAATISTNTSYFVNPIAQTMEYYPSNFNTALLNMMNAACGTSASHVSHLMISEAAVDAKISNVAAVAEGKTNSYVVEKTQGNSKLDSQNDSVVLSSGDFPLTTTGGSKIAYADLKIGDIIYITNTNVPDRWVGLKQNNSATLYKMETAKVDLANYYTKSEVDALIESKISQYLTSIEADDVEFGNK